MLLTRKAEFSASHVCANPAWTAERNQEVYGNNANPNGHGHNYVLEVTVEGDTDPVTGMVFDLRYLNREVPPFDRVVPTTENIAAEIWRRIEPAVRRPNARLHNVRLYETADLFVDYGGSDEGH
jgi:6-pyruvoyltetrahydropterin/6-carboxytetrahydropterin synthase